MPFTHILEIVVKYLGCWGNLRTQRGLMETVQTQHRTALSLGWNPEPSAPACSPAMSVIDANNCPGKKMTFCIPVIHQGSGLLCENMWTFLLNPPDHPGGHTPFTALFKLLANSPCFCLEFSSSTLSFHFYWTVPCVSSRSSPPTATPTLLQIPCALFWICALL